MMKSKKKLDWVWLTMLVIAFAFVFFENQTYVTHAEDTKDIQKSITEIQKKISSEQAAKARLEQELQKIQQTVGATQAEIARTKALIDEVQRSIDRKEQEVRLLDGKIKVQRELLKSLVQEVYYAHQRSALGVVFNSGAFPGVFADFDNLESVEKKLVDISQDIKSTKEKIEQDKSELVSDQEDHEQLLAIKKIQQQGLLADKQETLGDIADKNEVISRLNKELSELQGDLAKILGKSYNAKDIKEAVEFASGKTGVPKGFLFGMLKMETNLGANVGGCTYGEVEKGAEASYKSKKLGPKAWATFRVRRDTFKAICKELGIDYQKQKVSCNPRGYTGTGGAMGVAQFMPDTWNAYKGQVTSLTGHRPPSPWNLTDGVTAMALKLSRVSGVTAGKESAYKTAACAYLGTCYKPYIDGILYWAKNYKQLI